MGDVMSKLRFWTGTEITKLESNQIFVYDSNPQGMHGVGTGLQARKFGSKLGEGRGLNGQSYGLITKNLTAGYVEESTSIKYKNEGFKSLTADQIKSNIEELYECARNNPDKFFIVAYKNEKWKEGDSKKMINGYTSEEMFTLFFNRNNIPANIVMHDSFKPTYKAILAQQEELAAAKKYITFSKSGSTFSLWHPAKFEYKGVTFSSAGQFMLYSKAMLFGDERTAQKVMNFNDKELIQNFLNGQITAQKITTDRLKTKLWDEYHHKMKDVAHEVVSYNDSIWKIKLPSIIGVAIREKYTQNKDLENHLTSCKNKTMVFATPTDTVLGVGLNKEEVLRTEPSKWPGENLLGSTLTTFRDTYLLKKTKKKTPQR
jgi:predicted NAD-dependent protein-ADP-ribosyltransferase YbiA (DUF1768 family)